MSNLEAVPVASDEEVIATLHPAPGNVILKRKPGTEGLLAMPSNSKEQERGIVLAVGLGPMARDGKTRAPMSVQPGDHVGWLTKEVSASFVHKGRNLVMVGDRDLKFVEAPEGLRPLHNYVIFQRATSGHRPFGPTGKIVAPDASKETESMGVAIAVGPGRFCEDGVTRYPMSIKPGDLFRFFGIANSFLYRGERYWVIQDEAAAFTQDPEPASAEERAS